MSTSTQSQKAFTSQLKKVYAWYTGGFALFVIVLFITVIQLRLQRRWVFYESEAG